MPTDPVPPPRRAPRKGAAATTVRLSAKDAKGLAADGTALTAATRAVVAWCADLDDDSVDPAVGLPGSDARLLLAHLTLIHHTLRGLLDQPPSAGAPQPLDRLVLRRRGDATDVAARELSADRSGAELVDTVTELSTDLQERFSLDTITAAGDGRGLPVVVDTDRGPARLRDLVRASVLDVCLHADDLSQTVPDRAPITPPRTALAVTSRVLTTILGDLHPGRSVEVRVPPFAAVQCGIGDPGPTHTRGTPPNVIETDALTFLRLAAGRRSWAETRAAGLISASGNRADLTSVLPLFH